jgi:predicted  nucleic acid-binding Zn-ribbon protein
MRFASRMTLLITLALSSLTMVFAQESTIEGLRSQLSDVQKRETELQARIKQLEEDLRPENIERFFALNGSTRPEELREQRRRQLESEKARVQTQLEQLGQSRVRLETAIATAEAASYRQSATSDSYSPSAAVTGNKTTAQPKQNQRRARRPRARRARRRG